MKKAVKQAMRVLQKTIDTFEHLRRSAVPARVPVSERRQWAAVGEQAFKRESARVLRDLLIDARHSDLAAVVTRRARGERVRLAIVRGTMEHPLFEILDREA